MDPASTTAGAELMPWISAYGYLALLPLFIIEGPVVGIASGVLISLNVLDPLPVFLLYTVGTIMTDTVVYYLSKGGNKQFKQTAIGRRIIGRVESVISQADPAWRNTFSQNYFQLMLLAKLAPINLLATLVAAGAGMLRVPLRKFYKPILIAQPIWSAAVIAMGFYLGDIISEASELLAQAGIAMTLLILFAVLYHNYLHDKVLQSPLGQFLEVREQKE